MKNMNITAFVFILFLTTYVDLVAQEAPLVSPGARVRVSAPAIAPDWIIGTVVRLGADTLVLKDGDQVIPSLIPLSSITSLEMSRGRVSRVKNGLIGSGIGFGSGILSGLIIDRILYSDYDETWRLMVTGAGVGILNGFIIGATGKYATIGYLAGIVIGVIGHADSDLASAILGVAFSGEIGIIIGGLAGLFKDSERWEDVPLQHIRLGILPHGGHGITFSVSLTF